MNLGKWITDTYKRKGDFAAKIGADPTLISRWMRGAGISEEYQAKIRKLGYKGPWPAEEAKEVALAPTSLITDALFYREIGKLEGRVEALEKVVKTLLEGYQAHILKEPGKAHPQASQQ